MKQDNCYWVYNLPLQVWFDEESDDARIVNYMPRKERCCEIQLSEVIGNQSKEEFFSQAAFYFDNLARLMREAAAGSKVDIYYHDQGVNKDD